jgi:hypothetical protein
MKWRNGSVSSIWRRNGGSSMAAWRHRNNRKMKASMEMAAAGDIKRRRSVINQRSGENNRRREMAGVIGIALAKMAAWHGNSEKRQHNGVMKILASMAKMAAA